MASYDIYDYKELLGTVTLEGGAMTISGPEADLLRDLIEAWRESRKLTTDEALVADLPEMCRGALQLDQRS